MEPVMPRVFYDPEKFREYLLSQDVDRVFPDGSRGGSCPLSCYAKALVGHAWVGLSTVSYGTHLREDEPLIPWQRMYSHAATNYSEFWEQEDGDPGLVRDIAVRILDEVLERLKDDEEASSKLEGGV